MKRQNFRLSALILFFKLFALVFLSFTVCRVIFLVYNQAYFSAQSSENLFLAFLHGLRFDLSATSLLNTPLFLVLVSVGWMASLQFWMRRLVLANFLLINIPALMTNLMDAAYFPYTGRRSGPEVFDMWQDVSNQVPQLFNQYMELALVGGVLVLMLSGIARYIYNGLGDTGTSYRWYLPIGLVSVLLMVVAARGGVGSKPLKPVHAYGWPSGEEGPIVLNTPFSLIRQKADDAVNASFFATDEEARSVASKPLMRVDDSVHTDALPPNVMILILESFGLEYFGKPYGLKSYAPFLESLTEKGVFFPNGIANGRRSIEAVPSILAGMPSLLSEAFIRSPYQGNRVYGLGEILSPYGYQTWFFHGANNGSMYFDAAAKRFGIDNYLGRDEYGNEEDFDGQWGIFDEPFLQFTANTLSASEKPFFATAFTISSHTPYTLPKEYQGKIQEGAIPMHRVVRYSDMALAKFFQRIQSEPWFNNTLFVITADHTSDNFDKRFATPLGRHQIPLLLYHPGGALKPHVDYRIAQQVDIPATVLDFLNLNEEGKLLPFGSSLLVPDRVDEALIREDGDYWLLSGNRYVRLSMQDNGKRVISRRLPRTFVTPEEGLDAEILKARLKAQLQLYFNGLKNNAFFSEEEKFAARDSLN